MYADSNKLDLAETVAVYEVYTHRLDYALTCVHDCDGCDYDCLWRLESLLKDSFFFLLLYFIFN